MLAGQSIIFGILASTTRRFQCFWTPYICIFAACAIADHDIWSAIVSKLLGSNTPSEEKEDQDNVKTTLSDIKKKKDNTETRTSPVAETSSATNSILTTIVKHVIVILGVVYLYQSHIEGINKEMEDLREFYDPDTVDLMEWINKDVPKDAAFTGSMQLLAGVRLCTWRPITNHPHFEDKDLRDRTREVNFLFEVGQWKFL